MNTSHGIILIEYDDYFSMDGITDQCDAGYIKNKNYGEANTICRDTPPETECYGLGAYGEWKIVIDRHKTIADYNGGLEKIAAEYPNRILALWIDEDAGHYEYRFYDKGRRIREYAYDSREGIQKNIGDLLAVEQKYIRHGAGCQAEILEVMKAITGLDISDIENGTIFTIVIYERERLVIDGFVYDQKTGKWVDSPRVTLFFNGIKFDACRTSCQGYFLFELPKGIEPSVPADQNVIVAEKDRKKGHIHISLENLKNKHMIPIK